MLTLPDSLAETLKAPVLFQTTLWKITREDGTILRFTDHDVLVSFEGDDFTPVGGFNQSATQAEGGLRKRNKELLGVLDASYITHDDLRAGLYDNATIAEYLVDWRAPWAGAIAESEYTIGEMLFTGEAWEANLIGLTARLSRAHGRIFTRECGTWVFSTLCGLTDTSWKFTGTISSIVTQRRKFRTSTLGSPAKADDWFNFGKFEWTSGANTGVISEVKTYIQTNSEIELQLATPHDIVATDAFTIWTGCPRDPDTCKDRFSNLVNFRGHPFIPGSDRALTTPEAR